MSAAVITCTGLGVSVSVRRTFEPVTITCCTWGDAGASCAQAAPWISQAGSARTRRAGRQARDDGRRDEERARVDMGVP